GIAWGSITGTLAGQTDLAAALAAKQPLSSNLTIFSGINPSTNVQLILNAPSYSAIDVLLGLTIGGTLEAWSANLDSWSAIAPSTKQATLTNPVTGPGGSSGTVGDVALCGNTGCTTITDAGGKALPMVTFVDGDVVTACATCGPGGTP